MRLLKISVSGLIMLLAAACATPAPPAPPPPTPPPAGTAEIDRSLVWQQTRGGMRHITSGFICPTFLGQFRFTEETIFPGSRPGFDVACQYRSDANNLITFYLTSFDRPVSLDVYLRTSVEAMDASLPISTGVPVPGLPNGDPITPWSAAFTIAPANLQSPDRTVISAVWVDQIGAWSVKARTTYDMDQENATATAVAILFQRARLTIDGGTT